MSRINIREQFFNILKIDYFEQEMLIAVKVNRQVSRFLYNLNSYKLRYNNVDFLFASNQFRFPSLYP